MFNQTFAPEDIAVIGLLVILEGVLSIDNALVLGLLAKRVPKHLQRRALTYGLIGAFVFRLIAIGTAQLLLKMHIVKLIGGAYLFYVAGKYFWDQIFSEAEEKIVEGPHHNLMLVDTATGKPLTPSQLEEELEARVPVPLPAMHPESADRSEAVAAVARTNPKLAAVAGGTAGFWTTVAVIELTDIAFAIDSILAAIALVGAPPAGHTGLHPKLWLVITGGMLGVMLMRVAASIFIKLLEKFPRFETTAYLLVFVIGAKLTLDWAFNKPGDEHPPLDFHHLNSPAFWVFWIVMMICFAIGFIPKRGHAPASEGAA